MARDIDIYDASLTKAELELTSLEMKLSLLRQPPVRKFEAEAQVKNIEIQNKTINRLKEWLADANRRRVELERQIPN